MGSFLSLPLLALAAIIQASVVPHIRVLGGGPDLVFLMVLAWAIHAPLEEGVVWAFTGGILQDLMSAAPVGMSVVGLVLVVFMVYAVRGQVYSVSLPLLAALLLAAVAVQQVTLLALLLLTGLRLDIVRDLNYVVIPTLAYNLVVFWPVYVLLRRTQRRYATDRRFFS
jgi:rod shape-determining protein MreD